MKPVKLVWLFWLGNAVVLGAIALFLWNTSEQTDADRQARDAAIANLHTELERKAWKPTVDAPTFAAQDMRLSPTARPKKPEPTRTVKPVETVRVEKTDEQLKSELQTELNRRFTLLRMLLSSDERYPSCAFLVSDGARLQWFEDMYLKEEYGRSSAPELRKLAYDLHVLAIDKDGVLVNAASFEKPEKHFDVRISVDYEPANMSISPGVFPREDNVLRPEGEHEFRREAPRPEDRILPQPRDGKIDPKDFDQTVLDELAKYVTATDDGLIVSKQLPEDSPARKYGVRGGEIIKTINGVSVKSMSDVRRVVRTQYDAGTREFVVGFERDGIPDTHVLTAPEKKD